MIHSASALSLTATLALAWTAAIVDFRTLKIPNALTVSGAVLGLSIHAWETGFAGLLQGLAGFGIGFALLLPAYAFFSTGAGDVKLMGALGALLGPRLTLWALLFAVVMGAAVAIVYAAVAWRTRGAKGPMERYAGMLRCFFFTGRASYVSPRPGEAMAERMPLAVPIAIGTTAAVLWPTGLYPMTLVNF